MLEWFEILLAVVIGFGTGFLVLVFCNVTNVIEELRGTIRHSMAYEIATQSELNACLTRATEIRETIERLVEKCEAARHLMEKSVRDAKSANDVKTAPPKLTRK